MILLFGVISAAFCFYPTIAGRQLYEAALGLGFLSLILSWEVGKKTQVTVGINQFDIQGKDTSGGTAGFKLEGSTGGPFYMHAEFMGY